MIESEDNASAFPIRFVEFLTYEIDQCSPTEALLDLVG